jgi:hypothetical protein
MKKLLLAAVVLATLATPAFADEIVGDTCLALSRKYGPLTDKETIQDIYFRGRGHLTRAQAQKLIADIDRWRAEMRISEEAAARNHCDIFGTPDNDAGLIQSMMETRALAASRYAR